MNTPQWRPVESSNIAAVSYVPSEDFTKDTGELFVRFSSGAEYRYEDFPAQLALDFFEADSLGKFFHGNIRSSYPGLKLEVEEAEATDDGVAEETGDTTEENAVNEGMPSRDDDS